MGLKNEKEFRRGIKSASGWLRKELGAVLNLRYTPELTFELDHSIEYGAHINEVLNSLNIRQDGDGEDGL
jgi:ribosome-binding factor A